MPAPTFLNNLSPRIQHNSTVRRSLAGHAKRAETKMVMANNTVVARHLRKPRRMIRHDAIESWVDATIMLALAAWTVARFMSERAAAEGYLAIAIIGVFGWKSAATIGRRPVLYAKYVSANDNLIQPPFPPQC